MRYSWRREEEFSESYIAEWANTHRLDLREDDMMYEVKEFCEPSAEKNNPVSAGKVLWGDIAHADGKIFLAPQLAAFATYAPAGFGTWSKISTVKIDASNLENIFRTAWNQAATMPDHCQVPSNSGYLNGWDHSGSNWYSYRKYKDPIDYPGRGECGGWHLQRQPGQRRRYLVSWPSVAVVGTKVVFAPAVPNDVLIFDTHRSIMTKKDTRVGAFGEPTPTHMSTWKWFGAATYRDKVYCAPYGASWVLVVEIMRAMDSSSDDDAEIDFVDTIRLDYYHRRRRYFADDEVGGGTDLAEDQDGNNYPYNRRRTQEFNRRRQDTIGPMGGGMWSGNAVCNRQVFYAPYMATEVLITDLQSMDSTYVEALNFKEENNRALNSGNNGVDWRCRDTTRKWSGSYGGTWTMVKWLECRGKDHMLPKWSGAAALGDNKVFFAPFWYEKMLWMSCDPSHEWDYVAVDKETRGQNPPYYQGMASAGHMVYAAPMNAPYILAFNALANSGAGEFQKLVTPTNSAGGGFDNQRNLKWGGIVNEPGTTTFWLAPYMYGDEYAPLLRMNTDIITTTTTTTKMVTTQEIKVENIVWEEPTTTIYVTTTTKFVPNFDTNKWGIQPTTTTYVRKTTTKKAKSTTRYIRKWRTKKSSNAPRPVMGCCLGVALALAALLRALDSP